MKFPLIGKFAVCAKAEPLHLKNNWVKERFMHLFKICVSHSNLKQFTYFKEVSKDCLFDKFANVIKTSMICNFSPKKIIKWYNESSWKIENEFTFRFQEKESLMYLRNFPRLIQMLFSNITDKSVLKRLSQVSYQSLNLWKILSYSVRGSDFTHSDLDSMKRGAHFLFKAYCLFEGRVTPSLRTLWNAASVNAEKYLKSYGFGLGCNTIEGTEQKYQKISQNMQWALQFKTAGE